MNIIIIGGGKVGKKLVEDFAQEGHSVVLVDDNIEVIEQMQDNYDVRGIAGNGMDVEVLKESGMQNCDMVVCVTDKDEVNALCCVIAKKLGAKACVARIRNRQYYKQSGFMRNELGINMIVNPDLYAANEISRMLRFPATIKTETFARGRVELAQIKLPDALKDKPIFEIYTKYKVKILICAVARGDEVIIPNGEFVLREGDRIHVTASHSEMAKFMKLVMSENLHIKNVMIVGGGRIAYYLANGLIESGMKVRIIENNREKSTELSEYIPKADVIFGDGTDQELLNEEGIDSTDAFVSLTGIDEENIVISMYARMKKVDKVITKINRIPFAQMLDATGIDSVVTPKDITANIIVGYTRALNEVDSEPEVMSLYRIVNNKAEAVEFKVSKESELTGVPIKDLKLKKNILIAAIVSGNKTIIPGGDTTIEVGDTVMIVTTKCLKRLTDIIA